LRVVLEPLGTIMKIEYDPERDLLYIYFAEMGKNLRKPLP